MSTPTMLFVSFSLFVLSVMTRVATGLSTSDIQKENEKCSGQDFQLYYDHGLDRCEECRLICDHAEIYGTVTRCQDSCPKYLEAMKCLEKGDHFYDQVMNACAACKQLCDSHVVTKTTDECQQKCAAYLDKQTPEQVPSFQRHDSLRASEEDPENTPDGLNVNFSLHPGWIAAIAVSVLALIGVALVAGLLYKNRSNQYAAAAQDEGANGVEMGRRRQGPVEESNQATQHVPHFAIPGSADSGVNSRQTEAFSDLRYEDNRNDSLPRSVLVVGR